MLISPQFCRRHPASRRVARAWWWVMLLAGLGAVTAHAEVSKENQIKAAFLYNFTKFIQWPAARFSDETSPITIGVIGAKEFEAELERIVRDRKVNGRSIVIVPLATAVDAALVHVVFVAAGEEAIVAAQLAGLLRSGVLVVGESERLLALGGTVTFTMAGDKVRFEINMVSAEQGGLKISAHLQKLATVVRRKL